MENNHTIQSDTERGLSADPKFLLPRYLYDEKGSRIFQQIMEMPEYYLTRCEMEIFTQQKENISRSFICDGSPFDLIELGSGDGLKTKVLLHYLTRKKACYRFFPVDISKRINDDLVRQLKREIPGLYTRALNGDYFLMMKELNKISKNRKVILFLGSNIGNFSDDEVNLFYHNIHQVLNPGDMVLTGFDLKKSPAVIMNAYHDPHGLTRDFNLNLLVRLNRELGADFDTTCFEQHTEYNPVSGDVKSFLVSVKKQEAEIRMLKKVFYFRKWEPVFMERSRKFDLKIISRLAGENGFRIETNFTDEKEYFMDSLWIKQNKNITL